MSMLSNLDLIRRVPMFSMLTDKSPVKVKADLAGKVVGVQDGSSAIDAIEKDAVSYTHLLQNASMR